MGMYCLGMIVMYVLLKRRMKMEVYSKPQSSIPTTGIVRTEHYIKWTEKDHKAFGIPVDDETFVEVIFADGLQSSGPAKIFTWSHSGYPADVCYYRVPATELEKKPMPTEEQSSLHGVQHWKEMHDAVRWDFQRVLKEAELARACCDKLALALVNHKHLWTAEERHAYDIAFQGYGINISELAPQPQQEGKVE